MAVGFEMDYLWYPVGSGDFLHAFFSTICLRLEKGKWGGRFPCLMNQLYQGQLRWQDIKKARKELEEVQRELKQFPPSQVVWDIDDLTLLPPWGDNISPDITDLSNYFVTSDGRDLIEMLFEVFREAEQEKIDIEVTSY